MTGPQACACLSKAVSLGISLWSPGPEHGRAEGLKEGQPGDLMPVLGQTALSSQAE